MVKIDPKNISPFEYFNNKDNSMQNRYLSLRAFFYDNLPVTEVAAKYGFTTSTVYSIIRDFKKQLAENPDEDPFFKYTTSGRKEIDKDGEITNKIISLRKQYLSVPDIKSVLDSSNINVSEKYILIILKKEGFARLPRRSKEQKHKLVFSNNIIEAPKSVKLIFENEDITSQSTAILLFIPYVIKLGIDKIITNSKYPETSSINRLSSILCFLALKVNDIRRYCTDDLWCMDRGLGLFAGLNVLPKVAWYSSYSSSTTRTMNIEFLRELNKVWHENNLLSDTVNMDFSSIPYWGDDDHLENNWSGKRGKALASILAVIAQEPDSGIICYGDTTVKHKNKNTSIIEFLDFYHMEYDLKYLIFDSKFTVYDSLKKLNKKGIKFVTIRRRGKNIVEKIESIVKDKWEKHKIKTSNNKSRTITASEEILFVRGYGDKLRHIYLTDNGKKKPSILITNDFISSLNQIVKKYGRRWLIEKEISEQIEFFHFNRVSSSMVIKVDFDLTMSILAHNLYRVLAMDLEGYSHCMDQTIYEKFLTNSGKISIDEEYVNITLKKKRNLPLLLEILEENNNCKVPWFDNRTLRFLPATST
jgi:transposase